MGYTGGKPPPERYRLRFLATSDVHAHLLGWDYYADRPAPDRGLTRLATLIARLRPGADLCLLLDNGDFLQGSPLGDAAALGLGLGAGGLHPVIAAMNALGYDAAALGNHEFSHGLAVLESALAGAEFPVLSANILTGPDQTLLPPTRLIRRRLGGRDIAIGVLGLTPAQTIAWEADHIDRPLFARDLVEAAADHAARLRAEGADVVVALCHAGIGTGAPGHSSESQAASVAALPGIDAVIAGHTHRIFPDKARAALPGIDPQRGLLHGKPAVKPGVNGSHLGLIELTLRPAAQGWHITGRRARLYPVARRGALGKLTARVGEDPALSALVQPAHAATRAWTSQPIGRTAQRMSSHFALVAPSETVRIVARAQAAFLAEALADTDLASLPILSAAAPYHAGGRGGADSYTLLPQGALTLRHLTDLYPFPNTIAALRVTGADIADWLEHAAALFAQVVPGARDAPLIDPDFPQFNFDSVEGLSYAFDLSRPATFDAFGQRQGPGPGRVRDLRLDGQPLDPARPLILATNSFRLAGAGGFFDPARHAVVYRGREPSRDALQRFITQAGCLPPPAPPNWRFCPLPDTSVTFDTAPDATAADLAPAGLRLQPLALLPDGFRRFRLHLD